jgi:branched-subunit amino acid aminotransferase/4-amino-4-deoxychorismate lyase
MPLVWINGQLADADEPLVLARDAGLLHGIGVFTTMLALGRSVIRLDRHLQRLSASCAHFSIPFDLDIDTLARVVELLLDENQFDDARLRLTVTRGVASPDAGTVPTVLLTAAPFEPYPVDLYERGMTVAVVDRFKLNPYDPQAGHKTLDYFSRFIALNDARSRGASEAIWFDVHNRLQSGSISNIFVVTQGRLLTPAVAEESADGRSAVLPGITRREVLDLARSNGIDTSTESIAIEQLLSADEVFLTNSIMGVMPVCRIERKPVGAEKPGEITRTLTTALSESRTRSDVREM